MKTRGLAIKISDCEKLLELKFDDKLPDLCKKASCEINALAIAKRCVNAFDDFFAVKLLSSHMHASQP